MTFTELAKAIDEANEDAASAETELFKASAEVDALKKTQAEELAAMQRKVDALNKTHTSNLNRIQSLHSQLYAEMQKVGFQREAPKTVPDTSTAALKEIYMQGRKRQ